MRLSDDCDEHGGHGVDWYDEELALFAAAERHHHERCLSNTRHS